QAPARPAQGTSPVVPRGPAAVPHEARASDEDGAARGDDHPSSRGGEQSRASVQGADDETGGTRVTTGTGGAPLVAAQALPVILRAECVRWVGLRSAGGATALPGVALLTAGRRDPVLVDMLCADLLAGTR
ncbi:MAG: hypothetical protein WAL50_21485, partial [Kineosporiaceae bacterium]